jgi:hypothetical protein
MLKKVLNLNGFHLLDKKEQKGILGKGSWPTRCCEYNDEGTICIIRIRPGQQCP